MPEEYILVNNLIRAKIIDIVRSSEVNRFIQEGLLISIKDLDALVEDGTRMLKYK